MNNISEKELFKFVFTPDKLAIDKHEIIIENHNEFNDDLKLLREIKKSLDQELPKNILERIHEKITKIEGEVVLNLVDPVENYTYSVFAADSDDKESKEIISSYRDESYNFIGKVINNGNKNKIYLFSKRLAESLEFIVKLLPSKETFYINSDDLPLIITPKQKIKQIVLKIA